MLPNNLIESELFGHEKGSFTGATSARTGRLEMAQGGTLFLDEVGNLPVEFQAKLLRVLQERRIERVGGRETIRLDVRVVSATNVNLKEGIRAGKFRQDLYYRLQEMTIRLPPLRERDGDISLIAQHFARVYAPRLGLSVGEISEVALQVLDSYPWPGNVRELENAIKSAMVLAAGVVLPEHLPAEICDYASSNVTASATCEQDSEKGRLRLDIDVGFDATEIDLKALGAQAADQAERSLLQILVKRNGISGAQMARMLGVDPKTLRTKLRRYGLETGRAADG
jgi:transcriptional regulator with GAF, ATPase, and Fis domain